jgi:hypothetical protein
VYVLLLLLLVLLVLVVVVIVVVSSSYKCVFRIFLFYRIIHLSEGVVA